MRLRSATWALVVLGLFSFALPETRTVIWKLDDVTAGNKRRVAQGFKRVADWADEKKTWVSMGIICKAYEDPNDEDVEWIRGRAVENGGRVEFWLHGWDHQAPKKLEGGVSLFEFQGQSVEFQTKHLRDAWDIHRKVTGLSFAVFGAPNNQVDANTALALDEVPELRIWMYGLKDDAKRLNLARSINMESATGKVMSLEKFKEGYAAKKPGSPLVLQGHAGMWNDESFENWKAIWEFLTAEGWESRTCAEWAKSVGR